MVASSAPAVLVGHLADATTTLRVGAGGVMLPNHSPLVIAEQFATLEALHPGRIDLGLGRAPGTDQVTARALRRAGELGADTFPEDVVELINYLIDSDGPPTHPAPVPGRGYLPEMWLLGSSTFSAQLAGHARTVVLVRLPLRPRSGRSGARAVPFDVPSLGPARPSPTSWWPCRWCAPPTRRRPGGWPVHRRSPSCSCGPGGLGPLATPEEAAAYRYSPQERALVDASHGHPPDRRPGPGPPRTGRPAAPDRCRRDHAVDPGPLLRGPGGSLTLVAEQWPGTART